MKNLLLIVVLIELLCFRGSQSPNKGVLSFGTNNTRKKKFIKKSSFLIHDRANLLSYLVY